MPGSRTCSKAPAAAGASSVADLPSECLGAIFGLLPHNCIPLAIRRLSKDWRQRYLQHTNVTVHEDSSYLPAWAVQEALPHVPCQVQQQHLLAAMARRGDLCGMQQLAQQQPGVVNGLLSSDIVLCAAAGGGCLDTVRWLVEEHGWLLQDPSWMAYYFYDSKATASAAARGHVHVLAWLRAQKPPFEYVHGTMAAAARGGHVETLQWLHSNGCQCQLDGSVSGVAAEAGQLGVLQYLRANNVLWSRNASIGAARSGHVHILRWLAGNGCALDPEASLSAADFGRLDVLQFLLSHGCYHSAMCSRAATGAHREVLLWLRQQGHEWTPWVATTAVLDGDLGLLSWLREQTPPCPWGSSAVGVVVDCDAHDPPSAGMVDCMQYALSNGCPWEMADYHTAQGKPWLEHVRWPGMPVRRSRRLRERLAASQPAA